MKRVYIPLLIISLLTAFSTANAQVATCDPSVPFYSVNLTGQPAGTWVSPVHSRQGNCCGTHSPDRCTSFQIILDTGAAMISFEIASGAIPPGSMYYQISCGPQIAVGQPICVTGPGPHYLTFCKPGNNTNTYRITSIPKPLFPHNDTARIGCSLPIHVLGLTESSITWNSIFPGASGAYNSYLSCVNQCDSVIYTPAVTAPPYIDYLICGTPIATQCGYVALCDTVRIYNRPSLGGSVSPNPATFCAGGPGVLVTGTASGGQTPYTYKWYDQNMNQIGTNASYNITTGGNYTLRIQDILYDSTYCPPVLLNVQAIAVPPPTCNAGIDQTLCANDPDAILQGLVTNATGGIWSGGAGSFNPSNTSLTAIYTPTAAEIASGSVTLTLTSTGAGGGCVNATDQVTLFFPPLLTVSMAPQSLNCNNSTVTLSPAVSGGVSPYSYAWNTGANSSSINVTSGNYCVGITDAMGCNTSGCTNVTVPSALMVTLTSTDATTNGGSDGTATATVSGGTLPYSYLWTPTGQTTSTATGLSYGVYSCTVTDANGCQFVSSVVVNEPRCSAFNVTASGTSILCYGSATGTATSTVVGGSSPYAYFWNTSPIQTTSSVSGLSAGTYLVTVIEQGGCIDVASVTISQPTQLINAMNNTNTSVVGGTDGSASANPSGGTSPYSYLWETGATTSSITGLSAGVYSVTITDGNGCSRIDSVQVFDPECASIIMNTYATSVSCPGGNDGTASAQILFGIPPYHYIWNNGDTTSTITGLTAGTYTVTGWGTLLCTHFANITVTEPSPLTIGAVPTNIRCNGSNDGTIDITVSGGTAPYTFQWSNGVSVEDQAYLGPGTYSLVVTDAHNCTATTTITITEPPSLSISNSSTDVTCNGGNDGALDITITGGQAPYTYTWSNGATTQDISALTAGNYLLVVTDANNCSSQQIDYPVNQPAVVTIDSILTVCPAPGSGLAQVTVYISGGSNISYQVSFDNGATYLGSGVYTTLLPVGTTYYVTAKDNNGCLTSAADTLAIDPAVDIQAVSFNPCISDGVTSIPVNLTLTGGNGGPLQVSFDNGTTYLPAGTYSATLPTGATYQVIAKDSSGCLSVMEPFIIPLEIVPSGVMSSYVGGFQVSCNGSSDGSIDVSATGGSGSLTYNWSNAATTEDISGLTATTYSVVITDSLSCTDTLSFTLTEPPVLTTAITPFSGYNGYNISCNGFADGSADLTVNGGVTSYTYSWTNGSTTEDISGLTAGSYTVTVTDANGCTSQSFVLLTEPSAMIADITPTDILCYSYVTGSADLVPGGGVPSYTFIWSEGSTTEDISGVAAGSYSVVITDANGCTLNSSVTITQPTDLITSGSVTNLLCYQDNTGSIDVSSSGATPSYSYNWSNSSTTEDVNGLAAGSYSVIITDVNGCADTLSFLVNEPTLFTTTLTSTSDYNGYNITCNGNSDGSIDVTAAGGTPGYTYNWNNMLFTEDLTAMPAGPYTLTATDANGCISTITVVLTEPAVLSPSSTQQNVLCNSFSTGSIDLSVNGGVMPYNYAWSNSATSQDISNLSAGSYSVTITDANACSTTSSFTITELSPVTIANTVAVPLCFGNANGSINLNVNGGTVPYTYSWSNGQLTEDVLGLSAGSYSVMVTDANGCTASDTFYLNDYLQMTSSAVSPLQNDGYNITFYGGNDGSIDLTAGGGVQPYTYSWSNGSTSEDLSGLPAGNYTVVITDANGCSTTASVLLTEPFELAMPTGFSPNADGNNDYFVVHGIEAFPDNNIEIYNRWGNLVYESKNYQNYWQGTSDTGEKLPDGTYFVILKIESLEKPLTGYVDLRR